MPRKATGKPAGRPHLVLRDDGKPDPVAYKPSPEALAALRAELHFYRLQEKGRADDSVWPVLASASQIARQAQVTPRAVQKWRKERWYEIHFWSEVLRDRLMASDHQAEAEKAMKVCRDDLLVWVKEGWPKEGFVESPVNGRRFYSPERYVQHLRQEGAVPSEWLSREKPATGV